MIDDRTNNRMLCFSSEKFLPVPGEESSTNSNRYGLALAIWIREKFIEKAYNIPEEPIAEDWGWLIMIQKKPFQLWIGCGNKDGQRDRWNIFIVAEPPFLLNLVKPKGILKSISKIEHHLEDIIRKEPTCRDITWDKV